MNKTNRRSFLRTTAATAAALSLPARSWAQLTSASDEVRVGVIGFRGRGQDHLGGLSKIPGVRITAVCDVDEGVLRREEQKWKDKGSPVEGHKDLRDLLESKSVDVVSIATPNHWHSLAAIWAIQAGKDVYVEKPVSHNPWEGRQLVAAARKHNRIVQTGTQSRSSTGIAECFAWLKEGHLGRILVARGLCYKPRGSIGKVDAPQPPPPGVDYDLWCGPASVDPIRRKQFHYDWHWIWNYGNGDLGNQGIHQMDIARWALGQQELSPRVFSVGGRLGYEDDGETPNTQFVFHDYPEAPLIFEVRGLPSRPGDKEMDKFMGASVGVILHCEGGYVAIPNYTSATAHSPDGKKIKEWKGSEDHYANFIKAVRSRKHTDLKADILEGHLSSALCHTGNISYRLGGKLSQPEIRDSLKSNANALETLDRMAEHLRNNGVQLDETRATLGLFLAMDPKKETFIDGMQSRPGPAPLVPSHPMGMKGAERLLQLRKNSSGAGASTPSPWVVLATSMLTREYRKPYIVPAIV